MDENINDILSQSVSSGDAGDSIISSVSSGDSEGTINVYYQVEVHTVSGADAGPQYTLFDKPLEEYTVSEGLLLILVVLAVGKFVWCVIKEAFKLWSW